MWRIRPPSDSPKTTMNSVEEMTGASTVCVHNFDTRSVSRRARQISPAFPVTGTRLGGADHLPEILQLARAAEVPPLTEVRPKTEADAHRPQRAGLLMGLDALGHDLHAEQTCQHDHRADDCRVLAVAA